MRPGRRLAIDVGTVRIGVAASDFHGILASGLATVDRGKDDESAVQLICDLIKEVEPIEIYVGLPIGMSGNSTASTRNALEFARLLMVAQSTPIRFLDERLSTVAASSALRSSGRDSKSGRKIIDQIAATVILEQALETEKSSGNLPGKNLEDLDE